MDNDLEARYAEMREDAKRRSTATAFSDLLTDLKLSGGFCSLSASRKNLMILMRRLLEIPEYKAFLYEGDAKSFLELDEKEM